MIKANNENSSKNQISIKWLAHAAAVAVAVQPAIMIILIFYSPCRDLDKQENILDRTTGRTRFLYNI